MEHSWELGGKMLVQDLPFQGWSALDSTLHRWRHKRLLALEYVSHFTLSLAGSLYGGLHIFAWNGPFTTTTERNLWRASCMIIAGPLPVALAASLILAPVLRFFFLGRASFVAFMEYYVYHSFDLVFELIEQGFRVARISHILSITAILGSIAISCIAVMLYLAARVYLIVECFINLAHLLDAAFQEPEWSPYIPHFGAG